MSVVSKSLRFALAPAALALAASMPASALEPGTPAPQLSLPGLKEMVDVAQLKGKVVYVDFWASWCGPCKQSFPFMNQLKARYADKGLEIVAVNLDKKRDDVDIFLAQVPVQFTIALDASGDSARRYEVRGMPSSVIIGRDGKVFASHMGFRSDDRDEIEQRIASALAAH